MAAPPARLKAALEPLRPAAMPLAYAAFTLLVFWRLWTPIEGAQGSFRFDPRFEYWGDLVFQARTLAEAQLALWNPFDRGGFPLYGDPQPGMLYPPNWPLLLWGAGDGGVPHAAILVKILAHWAFGAIGMHVLLRRLGAPEPACGVGGVIFAWTSPKIRYGGSALNWSVAWIPWLLVALHWLAERPSWRRGAVAGTCAAMVLLAGAPAVVLYAALLAVPLGLWWVRGELRAALGPLAVAVGVSVLWIAPLVASNLEQLPASVREARDLAFVTRSVFGPAHVIGFVVPRLGGENPYVGMLPLLGFGALVAASGRGRALVVLAIAAAGLLLAFGEHAGVLPAVASALPPFTLFRRAHRYLYITMIALAIGAGLGIAYILAADHPARRRELARKISWVGGAATIVLGIGYVGSVALADRIAGDDESFGLALASAAAGTWLLRAMALAGGRARRAYAWIAVAVVAVDIWTANAKILDVGMVPLPETDRDHVAAKLEGVRSGAYRVYDRGYLNFRPGTRLGIRDFGGYEDDPLGLSRYKTFLRAAKKDLDLLGHANVRYYLMGSTQPKIRPGKDDAIAPVAGHRGVYELEHAAPAVLYVPRPTRVDSPRAAVQALRDIRPGAGAVIEGTAPRGPADADAVAGEIVHLEPNRVVAEVETPGPGVVVVSEAYYREWDVTVNGEPAKMVPANGMFRGIPVHAAGHHRIEMTLSPVRFWGLLPAYAAAWLVLAWAAAGPHVRRRKTPSAK